MAATLLAGAALGGLLAHLDVNLLEGEGESFRRLDALGVFLVFLQTLPLAFRRRAPVRILGVTGAALMAFSLLHYPPSLASFGFVLAVFTVASSRERHVSIPAGIGAGVAVLVILLIGRQPAAPDAIVADYLIVGAAWFLGEGIRLRRIHLAQLQDRATRLELQRDARTREAVAKERRVIARELHDVVAHNVSVIVAQAGAARRVFDDQPQDVRAALEAVERTGREALVEMRRLTGFLRTEQNGNGDRSPQPGLRSLPVLLGQVRDAGLPVTLVTEGHPRPLPAGLDLSAYRIVQEALTNTIKHAGANGAEVVVAYGDTCLELTISDDGRGQAGFGNDKGRPRYGQLGMRERVALFGGDLRVGPEPGVGYRVRATLPLDSETP